MTIKQLSQVVKNLLSVIAVKRNRKLIETLFRYLNLNEIRSLLIIHST